MSIGLRQCAILSCFTGIVVLASGTPEEDRTARIRRLEAPYRKLEFGQSLVKVRPSADFVDFTFDELLMDLKGEMYNWLAFTVQWEAHPQPRGWPHTKGGDFGVRVFAAYEKPQHDLIEYRWKRFGQELRVVASRNAMYFDIDLDELLRNSELAEHGDDLVDRAKALILS